MITDDDVFELFVRADPARREDDHSLDVVGDLVALRTRSNNVTNIEPTPTSTSTKSPEQRRSRMLGVAAAVLALVVAGIVLFARDDDPGQQTPATLPLPAPSSAAAIDQATAFLASFEMRDMTAVERLLADGFTMQIAFPGEPLEEVSSMDWLALNHQVASAVNYVDPICSVVDEGSADTVVECRTVMELGVHQSTNDYGLATTASITLDADGVVGMDSVYAVNFGASDLAPFDEWVEANRPDVRDPVADPQSFADLELNAQAESALLDEWIAFGVDAAEGTYADLNAGNVDAFLARFVPGGEVFGVSAGRAPAAWRAAVADGDRHESSDCGPAGVNQGVLVIACEMVITRGQLDLAGVHLAGTDRLGIGPDGLVAWSGGTVDFEAMYDLNQAFEDWMAENLPAVHSEITWISVAGSIATHEDQTVIDNSFAEFIAASDVYPLGG